MAILFQLVSTFDLPKDTYPLRQNEQTLKYYIIINKEEYTIDLNNEFSVTDINGINQECNVNYKCQYCDQFCRYIDKNLEFLIHLQIGWTWMIEIENIKGDKQLEEFIALHSIKTNQIGFGMRRLCTDLIIQDRKSLEFYFSIKYLSIKCSFIVLLISRLHSQIKIEQSVKRYNNIVDSHSFLSKYYNKFQNSTRTIPYFQHENVYSFKFKHLQIGLNANINIENVTIQVDSLNPFTELPQGIFNELANYYKQFGFSIVNHGYLSLHEKKFILQEISAIRLYINETFYLEYQPYQFLYYSGDYIQLPFKQSKNLSYQVQPFYIIYTQQQIKMNRVFHFHRLIVKAIQYRMNNQFILNQTIQNNSIFTLNSVMITFGALLLIAILFKLCKKSKPYNIINQNQEVELQNSTVDREKEEEQQI